MASSAEKDGWVSRVLGIALAGGEATNGTKPSGVADPVRWRSARAAWQDAMDTVDGQVADLQKVLLESGDDDLEEIAEYGLNGVTAGHKVPLMAIMMEIGAGSPEALSKSGPKALALVRAFRQHVESNDQVAACDEADEKPTAIRATLGPALAELEAALAG